SSPSLVRSIDDRNGSNAHTDRPVTLRPWTLLKEPRMSTPEFEHLRLSMVGDVALVEILSRDLQGPKAGQEFGTELALVLAQDAARRILLDFRRTAFVSSSSLAALFKLVNQARAGGRELKFC